ncbi:hypothetical protein KSF78_0008325 [Schistosoma japonicum]|nr:hypothetical protein KSF78_0008325 [Schistosoma japonicum]
MDKYLRMKFPIASDSSRFLCVDIYMLVSSYPTEFLKYRNLSSCVGWLNFSEVVRILLKSWCHQRKMEAVSLIYTRTICQQRLTSSFSKNQLHTSNNIMIRYHLDLQVPSSNTY